jgi:hypothetical protein
MLLIKRPHEIIDLPGNLCPNRNLSVDPNDFLSDQLDFQDIDCASQLIHCRHASLASPIPFGQFKQNGIPNQLDRAIAWADERREVITRWRHPRRYRGSGAPNGPLIPRGWRPARPLEF